MGGVVGWFLGGVAGELPPPSPPPEDTAEMQGGVGTQERERLWAERRVFYCTPQTFNNDISRGACDGSKVVCVVIDEAHKAKGDYAYSLVVKEIAAVSPAFRVLALSATPGKAMDDIQEVINNLMISKIEVRGEDEPGIQKYRHQRMEEILICETNVATEEFKSRLASMIKPHLDRVSQSGESRHAMDPSRVGGEGGGSSEPHAPSPPQPAAADSGTTPTLSRVMASS